MKKVDTAAIVSEKESPQVETKSILKPTEAAPSEAGKENRAIINGGQDLKHIDYEGQPATSATMVYSIFSSPLANGGKQDYLILALVSCCTKYYLDSSTQLLSQGCGY